MIVRISEVTEKTAEIRLYSGDDFDGSRYLGKDNGGEIALVIDEGDGVLAASTLCATEARALAAALVAAADAAENPVYG